MAANVNIEKGLRKLKEEQVGAPEGAANEPTLQIVARGREFAVEELEGVSSGEEAM